MKRKFSLKKSLKKLSKSVSSITAFVVIGVMCLVVSAGAVGYQKVFNIENYYESQSQENLGGEIHNVQESFDAGIAVNGVEIIDSDGVYVGTVEGTIATSAAAIVGSLTSYGALTAEAITGSSTFTLIGAATLSSTLGVTGESNFARIIYGGSVYSSSTSKDFTLLAADVCDNNELTITTSINSADSYAVTMPATSTISSDCLTAAGDSIYFNLINGNTLASTTVLTAGTDYNFYYNSTSTTVGAGKSIPVECRRSATAYDCFIGLQKTKH